MPLYEYYCAECNGVFELLRPARQATMSQPCPECDAAAKRIMSLTFAAFISRDGYPRRIPDDGSYYHLGKRVSAAMTHSIDGYTHPELADDHGPTAPSIEEIEQFQVLQESKASMDQDLRGLVPHEIRSNEADLKARIVRTKGTRTEERAKQAALKAERAAVQAIPKDE